MMASAGENYFSVFNSIIDSEYGISEHKEMGANSTGRAETAPPGSRLRELVPGEGTLPNAGE